MFAIFVCLYVIHKIELHVQLVWSYDNTYLWFLACMITTCPSKSLLDNTIGSNQPSNPSTFLTKQTLALLRIEP